MRVGGVFKFCGWSVYVRHDLISRCDKSLVKVVMKRISLRGSSLIKKGRLVKY